MLTDTRSLISLSLSIISAAIVAAVGMVSGPLSGFITAAILGCICSSRLFTNLVVWTEKGRFLISRSEASSKLLIKDTLHLVFRLFVTIIVSVLTTAKFSLNNSDSGVGNVSFTQLASSTLWEQVTSYAIFAFTIAFILSRQLIQVFMAFGSLRNFTGLYKEKYRSLVVSPYLGLCSAVPYFAQVYIITSGIGADPSSTTYTVWNYILAFRALRNVWQNAEASSIQVAIMALIDLSLNSSAPLSTLTGLPYFWNSLYVGTKLLLIGYCHSVVQQFIDKMCFVVITIYYFAVKDGERFFFK